MDSWKQEGMFGNNQGQHMVPRQQKATQPPTMMSYNVNPPQGFYRPANPQQFYMNQSSRHSHLGFQAGQVYPGHTNSMPQQFMPVTPQSQPIHQMTRSEQENMRKKKNFEEQQRRLLALKQKGSGQMQKTQVDNPLDNLFGNKGSLSNASSLLGSLGNTSKPKDVFFQGAPGQFSSGFSAPSAAGYQSSNQPVTSAASGLHSSNMPANYLPAPTNTLSSSVEDDFGDFQQSREDQSLENIEKPLNLDPSASSAVIVTSVHQTPEIISSVNVLDSSASFSDNKTNEKSSILQDTAAPTPSIEELMSKSLILNKQSQISVKKFQKPKLAKLIKSQPSHFSESTKASKWDNLDSLSEMFTIPQPVATQSETVYDPQSHVILDSSDDWSDFSGTDQSGTMFQEQVSQGLVKDSFDHSQPTRSDFLTSESEQEISQGNEMLFGVPSSGLSGTHVVQAEPVWKAATLAWPDLSGVMTQMQGSALSQEMIGGTETIIRNEVVLEQNYNTQLDNQGLGIQDVAQESLSDPDKYLYGVHLPEWSKDTTMLPAVYKQIHKICSNDAMDISTSQLYPILLSSELPRDKLGHIWSQCNKAIPGQLNEQELYLILGMVALAQVGLQVNKLTLEKLASCTTAPIPSFPEEIFQPQNDSDQVSSVLLPQTNTSIINEAREKCADGNETEVISGTPVDNNILKSPAHTIDAVKQPDWSKWKTSKASHVDDKFADFQMIAPNNQSTSIQGPVLPTLPYLNFTNTPVTSNSMDSFDSLQTSGLTVQAPLAGGLESTSNPLDISVPSTLLKKQSRDSNKVTSSSQSTLPELQPFSSADSNSDTVNSFGNFSSSNYPEAESQMNTVENKTVPASAHFMSVPLQASQRYALTEEDESIDHHEKAWLKCVTSCFAVITKSCQVLQNVTDPYLLEEIFSSPQGISHFSAIVEIYCVSQRVKASVLKSAPNNKNLKESLENIENVWKVCLGFQSFKALLPSQSLNFSGCHVHENEDLNLTCGVCLLNVNKSWVTSLVNKGHTGKLSYGSRYYHTTCANFWCNKVDSVLPALQINVGDSLI